MRISLPYLFEVVYFPTAPLFMNSFQMLSKCCHEDILPFKNPVSMRVCGVLTTIPTLFRDYHLSYFTSISSHFSAVLALFFFVLFSLSSLVLQNMLQLSFLNSSLRFAGHIFPNKKPNISLSFFLSIRYIQSVY